MLKKTLVYATLPVTVPVYSGMLYLTFKSEEKKCKKAHAKIAAQK